MTYVELRIDMYYCTIFCLLWHASRMQFLTLLQSANVLSHGTDVSNDSATTLYVRAKSCKYWNRVLISVSTKG